MGRKLILCSLVPILSTGVAGAQPPDTLLSGRAAEVDRNRDNRITFEEFIELQRGNLIAQFHNLDRNKDNTLTGDEITGKKKVATKRAAAFRASRWEFRQGIREGRVIGEND